MEIFLVVVLGGCLSFSFRPKLFGFSAKREEFKEMCAGVCCVCVCVLDYVIQTVYIIQFLFLFATMSHLRNGYTVFPPFTIRSISNRPKTKRH